MPHVVIVATPKNAAPEIVYREQVKPAHVQDDHSAAQLIQRVGWAVVDAQEVEDSGGEAKALETRESSG